MKFCKVGDLFNSLNVFTNKQIPMFNRLYKLTYIASALPFLYIKN